MDMRLSIPTGGIIGLTYGWVLGRSLFEPESGWWIPIGVLGIILGIIVGWSTAFSYWVGPLGSSTIGLFLGWLFASWLFGEHLGGVGMLVAIGGAIIGWRVGRKVVFRQSRTVLGALLGVLHLGFGIGILLLIVFTVLPGISFPGITGITIGFIIIGSLGGLIGAWLNRENGSL